MAVNDSYEQALAFDFKITGRDVYPLMFRCMAAVVAGLYLMTWLLWPEFFDLPVNSQFIAMHMPMLILVMLGGMAWAFGLPHIGRRQMKQAVQAQQRAWFAKIGPLLKLPDAHAAAVSEIKQAFLALTGRLSVVPYSVRFSIVTLLVPAWLQNSLASQYEDVVQYGMQGEFNALLQRLQCLHQQVKAEADIRALG